MDIKKFLTAIDKTSS